MRLPKSAPAVLPATSTWELSSCLIRVWHTSSGTGKPRSCLHRVHLLMKYICLETKLAEWLGSGSLQALRAFSVKGLMNSSVFALMQNASAADRSLLCPLFLTAAGSVVDLLRVANSSSVNSGIMRMTHWYGYSELQSPVPAIIKTAATGEGRVNSMP